MFSVHSNNDEECFFKVFHLMAPGSGILVLAQGSMNKELKCTDSLKIFFFASKYETDKL